jgi:hypothetical protein
MERIQSRIDTSLPRNLTQFRSAAHRLQASRPAHSRLRVLSFGCSLGCEIVTLASIFPGSEIHACDVDPIALEVARRNCGHMTPHIFASSEREIVARGPFDLIAACSVLCLNPSTDFLNRFPPARFDEALGILDRALDIGGLLVLHNCGYPFRSSAITSRYRPVRSDIVRSAGFVDVFDRSGEPFLRWTAVTQLPAFYRRGPAFHITDEEELADSIFERSSPGETSPVWIQVAPPPQDFEEHFHYAYSNLDAVPPAMCEEALEVHIEMRFGRDRSTGSLGHIQQTRWKSLIDRQIHTRPAHWVPQFHYF